MTTLLMPARALAVAVALLAGALLAAGVSAEGDLASAARPKKPKPTKPNIVVVMTDDQDVASLGVMKNVRSLLVRQGTTFANNFVTFSLCCPSRATYLTGQYPHNHTILGNAPPAGGYDKLKPSHANTLPAWLQAAGYRTVHIGKYPNGYTADDGVPPGWTEWYGSVDPLTYSFYNYVLNENGTLVRYGDAPFHYQADVYSTKAVDAIRRLAPKRKPFFLSVAYLAPHSGAPIESDDPASPASPVPALRHKNAFDTTPLPATPSLNEADVSDKPVGIRNRPLLTAAQLRNIEETYQQRLESLLAVDEGIARIIGALRRSGELRNTLFVFTADNGFFHGEHRVPAGKVLLYEPSIRVPLIMRGAGVLPNRTVNAHVANIDLAPTILAAAKASAGRTQDGVGLLAVARGKARPLQRDLLIVNGPAGANAFTAIRTLRYLYAEYGNGEKELYDLASDPYELQSRHADPAYAPVQAQLAARLAVLRTCAGVTCRVVAP